MVEDLLLTRSDQLLLDTNVFIYFLDGEQPYYDALVPVFRRVQAGNLSIIVSVITEAELLVRPERDGNDAAKERIADLLSESGIHVVGVDRKIARRAAALRGRSRFHMADAIIAATAIETDCDAIVGSDADWAKKELDVLFVNLRDIVTR